MPTQYPDQPMPAVILSANGWGCSWGRLPGDAAAILGHRLQADVRNMGLIASAEITHLADGADPIKRWCCAGCST